MFSWWICRSRREFPPPPWCPEGKMEKVVVAVHQSLSSSRCKFLKLVYILHCVHSLCVHCKIATTRTPGVLT